MDASESPVQRPASLPNVHLGSHQPSPYGDHVDESDALSGLGDFQFLLRCCKNNARGLVSRFIQLVCRPTSLGPLILDICSLLLSLLRTSQPGVDFLYPLSSLTKRQSGRLGRLILNHSKSLLQDNIHDATVIERGFDPPSVVVIDLNEVPRNVIERGYTVPADIYGFVILATIVETIVAVYLYIFIPVKVNTKIWLIRWIQFWLGERLLTIYLNWGILLSLAGVFCGYAILRGNGALALVRRSEPITPAYVVFLDRGFTVILSGSQSVIEAIAESSFTISHSIPWKVYNQILQVGRYICYEAFKALSSGLLLTLLVGTCLVFRPSSLFIASVPMIPVLVISGVWSLAHARELPGSRDLWGLYLGPIFLCVFLPSFALFLAYGLAFGESESLSKDMVDIALQYGPLYVLSSIPTVLSVFFIMSSSYFPIRTTKFLDILGNPPIRKWEFDTLATAATFQCLVLCRGTSRPIKTMDMLALLDIFIPDQTEVWVAWKNRVADRITHEVDISFAPTLPMFGDQRQKHLKGLLDQAQVGYDAYRKFYDWHVPLYPTADSPLHV